MSSTPFGHPGRLVLRSGLHTKKHEGSQHAHAVASSRDDIAEVVGAYAHIRFIRALLGHDDLSSTEIYTRVTVEKLREVLNAAHPAKVTTR